MTTDLSKFTPKHKKFFSQPRTMQEIINLFGGDPYEANSFQSIHLIGRNIKMFNVREVNSSGGYTEKLHLVNYDYKE